MEAPLRTLLVVLEYEIRPTTDPMLLDRLWRALRDRAIHEPIEGARYVMATMAHGDDHPGAFTALCGHREP